MPRVLIVDDEQLAALALRRLLQRAGFSVEVAYSGEEGLEKLATFPAHIVISDFLMPGMTGTRYLTRVRDIAPSALRVLMSAFVTLGAAFHHDLELEPDIIDFFFEKPWNDKQLVTELLHLHMRRSSGKSEYEKPRGSGSVEPARSVSELRPGERLLVTRGRFQGLEVSVKSVDRHAVLCVLEVRGQRFEQVLPFHHLNVLLPPPPLPEPWVLREKLLALREAARKEGIALNEPATDAQLDAFESQLGLSVPEGFRALYRTFDGCRYDAEKRGRSPLVQGASLVPLDDILSLHRKWNRLEEETFSREFRPGEYWNAGWIPFLEMGDWGLGVIDTVGCFDGPPGQLIQFNHKEGAERGITHLSFDVWLLMLLEGGVHPMSELSAHLNPGHPRLVRLEPVVSLAPRA